MDQSAMSRSHQSAPWDWALDGREARTLAAVPAPRWLRVDDGCLWLTRRDSHGQRDDDLWLTAGQSLPLPAGTEWILQAWPQARVSLLLEAPVPAGLRASVAAQRWWQRPAGWLRFSLLHA